jgi:molecular chaperone GrpE
VTQEETTTPVNETEQEQPQTIPEANGASTEVSTLKAQVEEYLSGWQRTRAEFANYKKRTDRELSESRQKGALETLTKLLPIIDDFERAMGSIPAEMQDNPWTSGVSLLLKKFEKLLSEYDVTVIDPTGQPFDPGRHEAIGMDDSDTVESGHVTVTLQKGYVSGDKVLRPALVRVAN